jgi:hypothetical protein
VDDLLESIGSVKLGEARETCPPTINMVDASTSDHKCYICGKGHTEKDCTFPQDVDCFRCGKKGHMSQSPLCKGKQEPPKQATRCTGKKHKNRPGWTRCTKCQPSGPCTDVEMLSKDLSELTSDDVVFLAAKPKPKSTIRSDGTTGEVSIQVTEPPVQKAEPACSVTIQSHVRYHEQGGTSKNCGSPSAGERFVISTLSKEDTGDIDSKCQEDKKSG